MPTWLIYQPDISPAAFRTWVQLRGLAWGRDETPRLRLRRVSLVTAKSESTLYSHMAILRSWNALRWWTSRDGTLIVAFDTDGGMQNLLAPDSKNSEKYLLKIPDDETEYLSLEVGIYSTQPGKPVSQPDSVYRSLTRIRPNQAQRLAMCSAVSDIDRWYATVEHWLAHKWNPTNIPGMLDLYQRGGAPACLVCRRDTQTSQTDLLYQIRKEIEGGSSPADSGSA